MSRARVARPVVASASCPCRFCLQRWANDRVHDWRARSSKRKRPRLTGDGRLRAAGTESDESAGASAAPSRRRWRVAVPPAGGGDSVVASLHSAPLPGETVAIPDEVTPAPARPDRCRRPMVRPRLGHSTTWSTPPTVATRPARACRPPGPAARWGVREGPNDTLRPPAGAGGGEAELMPLYLTRF